MFDPEKYTISVKKDVIDGETYFVATVSELKDVEEFGDTPAEAYSLAIETITLAYQLFLEKGLAFPEPNIKEVKDECSGRVTLRLPKSLHAKAINTAKNEGVSLNSFLCSIISEAIGRFDSVSHFIAKIENITKNLEASLSKRSSNLVKDNLNYNEIVDSWFEIESNKKHLQFIARTKLVTPNHSFYASLFEQDSNVFEHVGPRQSSEISMNYVAELKHVKAGEYNVFNK